MPRAAITILFRHPSRRVLRRPLREFLHQAARRIAPNLSVTCLVTDDRELHRLNRDFRNKDAATDVLSFSPADGSAAEMAISLDRAAEQAADFGHSLDEELRILMLHGLLHLAGMDHETDRGEMARTETLWRKRLKLPSGLIERARI